MTGDKEYTCISARPGRRFNQEFTDKLRKRAAYIRQELSQDSLDELLVRLRSGVTRTAQVGDLELFTWAMRRPPMGEIK